MAVTPSCLGLYQTEPQPVVRQLRPHAVVLLQEHGEDLELSPAERVWLLVDLGAGLLEGADPRDVAGDLLPDVGPDAQSEIVADLSQVGHPAIIGVLTALGDHHPESAVAAAAREALIRARGA